MIRNKSYLIGLNDFLLKFLGIFSEEKECIVMDKTSLADATWEPNIIRVYPHRASVTATNGGQW